MARKSKYTPELISVLLDAISTGMTDGDACLIAGISEKTFYEWQNTKSDFRDRVTRARPAGWKAALARIQEAGKRGDWRADAEYLDRTRSPYRKSTEVKVTHEIDRAQAEQLAEQYGLDVDEVIAEAERHLADARRVS